MQLSSRYFVVPGLPIVLSWSALALLLRFQPEQSCESHNPGNSILVCWLSISASSFIAGRRGSSLSNLFTTGKINCSLLSRMSGSELLDISTKPSTYSPEVSCPSAATIFWSVFEDYSQRKFSYWKWICLSFDCSFECGFKQNPSVLRNSAFLNTEQICPVFALK